LAFFKKVKKNEKFVKKPIAKENQIYDNSFVGSFSREKTPDPISNSEVKVSSADGSASCSV
jgi:hypothetical protein